MSARSKVQQENISFFSDATTRKATIECTSSALLHLRGAGASDMCKLQGLTTPSSSDSNDTAATKKYVDDIRTNNQAVTGDWSFGGDVAVTGDLSVGGSQGLAVTNNQSIGGYLAVTGNVSATQFLATSDARLKENVQPLNHDHACSVLDRLQPVSFTWKETGKEDVGFIAQDVAKVLPHLVVQGEDGLHRVDYAKMAVYIMACRRV